METLHYSKKKQHNCKQQKNINDNKTTDFFLKTFFWCKIGLLRPRNKNRSGVYNQTKTKMIY